MDKKTVGIILTVAIVVMSTFLGLSTVLPTLDQTNIVIATLTSYFTIGTVLIAVAFIRNIIGFITEWVKSNYGETFNDQKLYQTLTYYLGLTAFLGTIPVALLPEPYGKIASGVIIVALTVVDLLKQAFGNLFSKET